MIGKSKIKSNNVYNYIKKLKQRGCPIDGVGFQSHVDLTYDDANYKSIKQNIERYNKLGLKVHFTETDVSCRKHTTCPFWNWPKDQLDKQGYIYCQLLKVCLNAPNCVSFESWGFTDKHGYIPAPQNSLIFDKDMQKKGAYYCMKWNLDNFNKNSKIAKNKIKEGYG